MKILQLIQRNQLRGAEIFASQLSTELVNLGHHVEIAVLFGENTGLLDFPISFHHLKFNESKGWSDWKGYVRLNHLVREGNYDIIQANAGDTLRYAALSKMFFNWKARLVFRNANKLSDFINNPLKRIVYKRLFKKTDAVASVSRICRNDFIAIFPFLEKSSYELPIGVNLDSKFQNTRSKYDSVNRNPVFLHAGGFVSEKNHKGLIRIFKSLLQLYPGARLVLAGSGPLEGSIRKLVSDMNISDSVDYLGATRELRRYMTQADIFLLPSMIEGLPAVILESFACGLPVVAYDTGGIGEVVINGKTGRLIEKNDEAAFVKGVVELLEADNEEIRSNARLLITEKYTNGKIARNFSEAYMRIIKS